MAADFMAVVITTPEQFIEMCEDARLGSTVGRKICIKKSLRKVLKKDGKVFAFRNAGEWSWDRIRDYNKPHVSYSFDEWKKHHARA